MYRGDLSLVFCQRLELMSWRAFPNLMILCRAWWMFCISRLYSHPGLLQIFCTWWICGCRYRIDTYSGRCMITKNVVTNRVMAAFLLLLRSLHLIIFVFWSLLGLWPWASAETLPHNISIIIQQHCLHTKSVKFLLLWSTVWGHIIQWGEEISCSGINSSFQFIFI